MPLRFAELVELPTDDQAQRGDREQDQEDQRWEQERGHGVTDVRRVQMNLVSFSFLNAPSAFRALGPLMLEAGFAT